MVSNNSLRKVVSNVLLLLTFCSAAFSQNNEDVQIQEWLQKVKGRLTVAVRQYNGTALMKESIFGKNELRTADAYWKLYWSIAKVEGQPDAIDLQLKIKLEQGKASSTAISCVFDFSSWNTQNYVLIPAGVYNGNRYRAIGNGYLPDYPRDMYYNPGVPLTISNNPRLAVHAREVSALEMQTANAATPAMCFYAPYMAKGFMLFTEQQTSLGTTGLSIRENAARDSCAFVVTAPSMRSMSAGFGDFRPSGDTAPDWTTGDEVTMRFRLLVFDAKNIPGLLQKFLEVRKDITGINHPRNLLPMSKVFEWGTAICSDYHISLPIGSYYLPENSKDFQLGWISGMINTYPMLVLKNEKERNRVVQELDFVTTKLQGRSGFFFGGITADGKIRPERMHPDFPAIQAMVRKNGDVLFWLIKHFLLLKEQGKSNIIKPEWEDAARKLAGAFAEIWKQHGEFGQYIVPETGEIAVFNSTAGARVPAGLVLASAWFGNGEWLTIAREAANYYYYRDIEKQGLTGGCCGDISQDPDSETAFGFLESLVTLYEATGDTVWVRKAEIVAALCATWTISYDPVFPPQSTIGKLKSNMAGAVWASIQNKHAAPGICTSSGDYLFRLYRATGNSVFADLIRDIQHAHTEAVNMPGHVTTNHLTGSSMERIQLSDAEGKGSIGNYINDRNSWTETSGMLMALELPGIYVQTDKGQFYTFDHIQAALLKKNRKSMVLQLTNTTPYDATVSIFAETSAEAKNPIPVTAFVHWPKVNVASGATINVQVSSSGQIKILK